MMEPMHIMDTMDVIAITVNVIAALVLASSGLAFLALWVRPYTPKWKAFERKLAADREEFDKKIAADREELDKKIAADREEVDKMLAADRDEVDKNLAADREGLGKEFIAEREEFDKELAAEREEFDKQLVADREESDKNLAADRESIHINVDNSEEEYEDSWEARHAKSAAKSEQWRAESAVYHERWHAKSAAKSEQWRAESAVYHERWHAKSAAKSEQWRAESAARGARIDKTLARLPQPSATPASSGAVGGTGPMVLMERGEKAAKIIEAAEWAAKLIPSVQDQVAGKPRFDIQEFCFSFVADDLKPDAEQELKIGEAAYECSISRYEVLQTLAIVMRDMLLERNGYPVPK